MNATRLTLTLVTVLGAALCACGSSTTDPDPEAVIVQPAPIEPQYLGCYQACAANRSHCDTSCTQAYNWCQANHQANCTLTFDHCNTNCYNHFISCTTACGGA
jgi:hypothetical protein